MKKLYFILCLLILNCALVANAQVEEDFNSLPLGLLKIAGVTLQKTTLKDIQAKYGGFIFNDGRDALMSKFICLYENQGKEELEIRFESGAMGGWSEVTFYRVKKTGFIKTYMCGNYDKEIRTLINVKKDILTPILGKANDKKDLDSYDYMYEFKIPNLKVNNDDVYRCQGLDFTYKEGKVESYKVYSLDSM